MDQLPRGALVDLAKSIRREEIQRAAEHRIATELRQDRSSTSAPGGHRPSGWLVSLGHAMRAKAHRAQRFA